MDRRKIALVFATVAILLLFNLFQIIPPFARSSVTLNFSFGGSPSRPYLLRVKVEKMTITGDSQTEVRPVSRLVVKLDEKVGVTNINGYVYFSTLPGKHVVSISSPLSLLPTYSVDVYVETPLTELRVRYIEHRLKIAAINISIDTAASSSAVLVSIAAPPNSTVYVGRPYLTYMDFRQYYKLFIGDGIAAYLGGTEIPYQGPFIFTVTPDEGGLLTASAVVPDMIQIVSIDESYVPVYVVENELLKMMQP